MLARDVNAPPAVELRSVSFAYESGPVLSDVNMRVMADDYAVLLGANGSGKSTLVRVALGLLEPASGETMIFGRPARDPVARERVGYVPQRSALSNRVPATVAEVVLAGRAGRKLIGAFSRDERASAMDALERVDLAALAHKRIGELSFGQQQRVLIARAIAADPELLVLDEPTAGVDRASQLRFARTLRGLHSGGVAIIVVAHDLGAVGGDVTRLIALHQGHIDELSPEEAREHVGLFMEDHAP